MRSHVSGQRMPALTHPSTHWSLVDEDGQTDLAAGLGWTGLNRIRSNNIGVGTEGACTRAHCALNRWTEDSGSLV